MKGKILYACNLKEQAKNARILYEVELLRNEGYEVDLLFKPKDEWKTYIRTLASFKIFNYTQIKRVESISNEYDYVVLFGVAVLPAVKSIDSSQNRVIYETMNRDVSYVIYELGIRFGLIRIFSSWLKSKYTRLEKLYSGKCKAVVVNSDGLLDLLPSAIVNYYTSPFENATLPQVENKAFGLLYIGQLRKEKGVEEIKALMDEFNIQLHFFGEAKDEEANFLASDPRVISYGNLSMKDLKESILKVMDHYNLIGTSLIRSVHDSYATQEANKEIDYLSLGIPFVGNNRETTRQKIELGCGVFSQDFQKILNLDFYSNCRIKCLKLYQEKYNNQKFKKTLTTLFQ